MKPYDILTVKNALVKCVCGVTEGNTYMVRARPVMQQINTSVIAASRNYLHCLELLSILGSAQ